MPILVLIKQLIMRKLILLGLLLLSFIVVAQDIDKFEIKKGEGFNDYIIYEIPEISALELKTKTVEFVESKKQTENDEIIKQDKNSITFNYFVSGGVCNNYGKGSTCFDVEVLVEILFKDGKYKYDLIDVYGSQNGIKKTYTTGEMDNFFKSNGKLRNYGEGFIGGLENSVNDYASELNNYLKGKTKIKSEW